MFYGEHGINGIAIALRDATISMTWLPSMSRFLDYVCMTVLIVVFSSVYLLSKGSRLLALLNSFAVSTFLLVELSLLVYFFDNTDFYVHFTDSSPQWFTNEFVLVVCGAALMVSVSFEFYVRRVNPEILRRFSR